MVISGIYKIRFVGFIFLIVILLSPNAFCGKEGWSWRESFDTEVEGTRLSINSIHTNLARQEFSLFEKLEERQQGKSCSTNIVLCSISFLVQDGENNKTQLVTEPLWDYNDVSFLSRRRPLVFLSDSAFRRGQGNPEPSIKIDELTQSYNIVSPYSLESMEDMLGSIKSLAQSGLSSSLMDFEVVDGLSRETSVGLTYLDKLSKLTKALVLTGEREEVVYKSAAAAKRLKELKKQKEELVQVRKTLNEARVVLTSEQDESLSQKEKDIESKEKTLLEIQQLRKEYDDLNIKGAYNHTEQNLFYHLKGYNFEEFFYEVFQNRIKASFKRPIFQGVLFHLHSRLDICERCAPVMALEIPRIGSKITEILQRLNPENTLPPVFHMLASVRQELPNSQSDTGYRRRLHGHDGRFKEEIHLLGSPPYFYIKIIEPFDIAS